MLAMRLKAISITNQVRQVLFTLLENYIAAHSVIGVLNPSGFNASTEHSS